MNIRRRLSILGAQPSRLKSTWLFTSYLPLPLMKHWLVATGIIILLASIVPLLAPVTAHPDIWLVLSTAAFPAFIVARVNSMAKDKPNDERFLYQMGTLMFRLLFSMMGLAAFLFLQEQTWEQKLWATGWFFLAYAVYAAVEIKSFMTNLRRH